MWYTRLCSEITCHRNAQGRIPVPTGQGINIHEEYNYHPRNTGDKLVRMIASRECDLHIGIDSV